MPQRPEDRRAADRLYHKSSIVCHRGIDGLGPLVLGQVMNVSATGAQALLNGELREGEEIFAALVGIRRQTVAEVRAAVRWRRKEHEGVWRVGISFYRPLTDRELEQL